MDNFTNKRGKEILEYLEISDSLADSEKKKNLSENLQEQYPSRPKPT